MSWDISQAEFAITLQKYVIWKRMLIRFQMFILSKPFLGIFFPREYFSTCMYNMYNTLDIIKGQTLTSLFVFVWRETKKAMLTSREILNGPATVPFSSIYVIVFWHVFATNMWYYSYPHNYVCLIIIPSLHLLLQNFYPFHHWKIYICNIGWYDSGFFKQS